MKLLFVWRDGRIGVVDHPEAPPGFFVGVVPFERIPVAVKDVPKLDVVVYEERPAQA